MAEKLDPKEIVDFKELLISNMLEVQALVEVLVLRCLKMPFRGTYCPICGLIQSPYRTHCYFCETEIGKTIKMKM